MESNGKIELYANTSQIMNGAIDRIVVEIHNKRKNEEGAQTVILTGCGPQCGTTSTCIGLGMAFAAAKWKTLIVDCDIRKAYKLKKLNQHTDKGLEDFLLEEDKEKAEIDEMIGIDDIIYSTNIDNLFYIPGGKYAENPTRLFCSERMLQVIEYVKSEFDYVIFDFPSLAVVPDAQIMFQHVDGIVLMAALKGVTKRQIKDAKRRLLPFADKYYGIIVNKVEMPLYKRYIRNFDYYFYDRKGHQKLDHNAGKKYEKKRTSKEVAKKC